MKPRRLPSDTIVSSWATAGATSFGSTAGVVVVTGWDLRWYATVEGPRGMVCAPMLPEREDGPL